MQIFHRFFFPSRVCIGWTFLIPQRNGFLEVQKYICRFVQIIYFFSPSRVCIRWTFLIPIEEGLSLLFFLFVFNDILIKLCPRFRVCDIIYIFWFLRTNRSFLDIHNSVDRTTLRVCVIYKGEFVYIYIPSDSFRYTFLI